MIDDFEGAVVNIFSERGAADCDGSGFDEKKVDSCELEVYGIFVGEDRAF